MATDKRTTPNLFDNPARVCRSIGAPLRSGLSRSEIWGDNDKGLIAAWECGRQWRQQRPELATSAERGELPLLPWKGGFAKKPKKLKHKYGTLHYLAAWRGLRSESLDISMDEEPSITCTKTGVEVTFTFDREKYLANVDEEDASDEIGD